MLGISPQNQEFLETAVASGVFATREQAIDQAVSLLRSKREALEALIRKRVALPNLPSVFETHADGSVHVRGHRVSLHLLLVHFFSADGPAEIQVRFPTLGRELIDQFVAYARAEAESLRAYFAQEEAIYQLQYEIGPRGPTREELRARWLAKNHTPE